MVLIDLDGTLIGMSPFADELDDPDDRIAGAGSSPTPCKPNQFQKVSSWWPH
jgi:hypothetical protein